MGRPWRKALLGFRAMLASCTAWSAVKRLDAVASQLSAMRVEPPPARCARACNTALRSTAFRASPAVSVVIEAADLGDHRVEFPPNSGQIGPGVARRVGAQPLRGVAESS